MRATRTNKRSATDLLDDDVQRCLRDVRCQMSTWYVQMVVQSQNERKFQATGTFCHVSQKLFARNCLLRPKTQQHLNDAAPLKFFRPCFCMGFVPCGQTNALKLNGTSTVVVRPFLCVLNVALSGPLLSLASKNIMSTSAFVEHLHIKQEPKHATRHLLRNELSILESELFHKRLEGLVRGKQM